MSAFEPAMSNDGFDSSETDRSRSVHGINAMQVAPQNQTPSVSDSQSRSSPETRAVPSKASPETRIVQPSVSPDTLSNFLREDSNQGSPGLPQNPFQGPPAASGPGPSFVSQTNVKNELHVNMDPYIIAQANQAIQQAREGLRAEAMQYVDAERGIARNEALAFAEHVHSEASRVVEESQSRVVQTQQELQEARGETSQVVRLAQQEIETVKAQAREEFLKIQREAQSHISNLEGRLSELIHMNQSMTKKMNEQAQLIEMFTKRIDGQNTVIAQMQSEAMRSPIGADNGTEFQISTPVGRHASLRDTGQRVEPMLDLSLYAQEPSPVQGGVQPLGSPPRAGKEVVDHKGSKKSSKSQKPHVDSVISQMKLLIDGLENKTPKAPTEGSRSNKSSGSSSSKSSKKGGSPGGSSDGSPKPSRSSKSSTSSSESEVDMYAKEKKAMRVKGYDGIKFPPIPKNAAEARGYRNSVYSAICKLSKKDESDVFNWISACNNVDSVAELPPGRFPVLDRTVGHKLLESARHTRFSLDFQTMQEAYQRKGKQPSGRHLLWHVFQKFKLDKDRGAALSQHHLLALKLEGSTIKSIVDFKSKFDYCAGSLEQVDMPSDSALRSLLFENLKSHPKMALAIDKFREAKSGSSKRTWTWLYQKMEEAIEIDQLDENTGHVEKALQSSGGHKVNAGPSKAEKGEKDKPTKTNKPKEEKGKKDKEKSSEEKGKKDKEKSGKTKKEGQKQASEAASSSVNAAPSTSKGSGKGKKPGSGKSPPLTPEEKAREPCMYFAFDSCTKGDKCPYLHDKNHMYSGPKPKALSKPTTAAGSATVHAGVAQVLTGLVASSSVKGAKGDVSSNAPHPQEPQDASSSFMNQAWKTSRSSVVEGAARGKRVMKDLKIKGSSHFVFGKAVKCIAAMMAVCNPLSSHQQEFLIDSGAGRNLISQKDLPVEWHSQVSEAPERLNFATGGGVKSSSKAVRLKGELSGEGVFYTLKDCPAAISLGQQVNEHGRAWIWFPNQLPFFVKSNRLSDITFHCPESAKIYANRVVENVPILLESVECLAMPAKESHLSAAEPGEKLPNAPPEGGDEESKAEAPEDSSKAPVSVDPSAVGKSSGTDRDDLIISKVGEPVDEYTPTSPAETPREMPEEGGSPDDAHSSEDDGVDAHKMLNHSLTHYPKSKHCEICKRAKMTSRYHRRKGEPDLEETPPLHFGHMMRVDHIVIGSDLSKGSEGEQACLICFDEYSGVYRAFPQTSRATPNNVACLRKFGGSKSHGRALCSVKSDAAGELTEAVKQLGWLPEPGNPNDPYHNAKLESNIRRIKRGH